MADPNGPEVDPAQTHNDQAERALLGAMLLSAPAVAAVIPIIGQADLYRPAHQLIWASIVESDGWGDVVLVEAELRRRGHLRQAGGGEYLIGLRGGADLVAPENAAHYAREIRDRADVRRRLETAHRLRSAVSQPELWASLLQAASEAPDHLNGATPSPARITYAADTAPRASTWLWRDRIPYAAITLIGGPGGVGKSTTSYDLLAKITRGQLDGELVGEPRAVAIVAAEEAWDLVAVPRLHAAGADLHRAMRIEPLEGEHTRGLTLPVDVDLLGRLCPELDVAVVFIDPIIGTLRGGLDTHKDADVRQALEPLAHMCETTHTSVIATIHLNKGNNTDPLKAFMGSAGFVNVARSAFLAIPDPQSDTDGRYLLAHAKSNNGPRQATLAYHLVAVTIEAVDPDTGREIRTSRVIWDGDDPDQRSAEDILATPRERPAGKLTQDILAWLAEHHPDEIVSSRDLANAFSQIARGTFDKQLRRMVERGQLSNSTRGFYALP